LINFDEFSVLMNEKGRLAAAGAETFAEVSRD
jgi:hypothetical protein